jgi:asparagine synthase (glutamine-hydrolysing)
MLRIAPVCGIAGIWERTGRPVERAVLERMGETLVHRGPDGSGIHLDGGLGLVNRRLRIVDVSPAGDQPLGLPDRGLWITYNGEVHDYVELRAELEARGAVFRTHTDTEVVLHAYAAWGTGCFERLNGMWGLAIWDERERELVLARDRFGIKPLVYAASGTRVVFASEAKAILAAFPDEREPDRTEIARFLRGESPDVGAATFFAGIRALEPAEVAVFRADGSERRTRCWSFQPGREEPRADAEEELRERLRDAVRLRLRSDVPVGVCLSGGLDSSAIAALMEDDPDAPPRHAFALRYDDHPAIDESRYSALAAGERFELHWVRPDMTDVLGTMRKIVWHHDAPTPLRGRFAQWFVMQEAGRHVKVALTGEGGDELLAGYSRFVVPYLRDRLRTGPRAGIAAELGALGELESRSRLWFLARAPLPHLQRAAGLPPWVAGRVAADGLDAPREPRPERPYTSALSNALWHELRRAGLPEVMHVADALSMAFSVESRPPFLDHRIVELLFTLPYTDKIADGWTKSLLRRSMRGIVAPEILARRRKLGFSSPVGTALRSGETFRQVRELLLDRRCLERGIFDPQRLERALRRYHERPALYAAHRTNRVWRWVTLELWFQQFVDG